MVLRRMRTTSPRVVCSSAPPRTHRESSYLCRACFGKWLYCSTAFSPSLIRTGVLDLVYCDAVLRPSRLPNSRASRPGLVTSRCVLPCCTPFPHSWVQTLTLDMRSRLSNVHRRLSDENVRLEQLNICYQLCLQQLLCPKFQELGQLK